MHTQTTDVEQLAAAHGVTEEQADRILTTVFNEAIDLPGSRAEVIEALEEELGGDPLPSGLSLEKVLDSCADLLGHGFTD
jgi:hypothetical protein